MSFGKKGLAPGQTAAVHPGGGFGRAPGAAAPALRPAGDSALAGDDEIAARREAFIAAERARAEGQLGAGQLSDVAAQAGDDLASLRNSARPARPMGEPMPAEKLGETGLPESQEAKIKAMAREMSHGGRSRNTMATSGSDVAPRSRSGAGTHKKKYIFGDPLGRSLVVAYIMWYFADVLGIHRGYCGSAETGWYQFGLFVGSIVISVIFLPLGLLGFLAWAIWLFADLFMMPGMMKRFKAAHEYDAGVFE